MVVRVRSSSTEEVETGGLPGAHRLGSLAKTASKCEMSYLEKIRRVTPQHDL